jgi:hypothetical protein
MSALDTPPHRIASVVIVVMMMVVMVIVVMAGADTHHNAAMMMVMMVVVMAHLHRNLRDLHALLRVRRFGTTGIVGL